MKRLVILLSVVLFPTTARATAHYPHTQNIGCARLGYSIAVPAAWRVVHNCAHATTITGGNPRFTIAIATDRRATWTAKQAAADATRLLTYLGTRALTYTIAIKPKLIAVAGHYPGTWAFATYVMKDAGNEFAEIYEVYSAGLLHRFLITVDYSGGYRAGKEATATIADMELSLHIR